MYNSNIHKDTLNIGQEYQDFVIQNISLKLGISISIFQSKKYQFSNGESLQGVEIKYDARSTGDCTYYDCKATGNLAIEVGEKSKASNSNFIESGIYRRDNTWLYIVGNYQQFWIFAKSTLILMHKSNKYREVQTLPTIKNMLLPLEDADKYCAKKIVF